MMARLCAMAAVPAMLAAAAGAADKKEAKPWKMELSVWHAKIVPEFTDTEQVRGCEVTYRPRDENHVFLVVTFDMKVMSGPEGEDAPYAGSSSGLYFYTGGREQLMLVGYDDNPVNLRPGYTSSEKCKWDKKTDTWETVRMHCVCLAPKGETNFLVRMTGSEPAEFSLDK